MITVYELIGLILLVALIIGYEVFSRKHEMKKILDHIDHYGGEVDLISRIASREHIYSVEYFVDDKRVSKVVKFTFTFEEIWY